MSLLTYPRLDGALILAEVGMICLTLAVSACASNTARVASATPTAIRFSVPGGSIVSVDSAQFQFFYEQWHFAPARVNSDLVFVSGVVAVPGLRDTLPLDIPGLEASYRRAWTQVTALLLAAGSCGRDIVEITSYHVFTSPSFHGTQREQIDAFRRVKDEFVPAPYPAWTGIGVASLFAPQALVEIRVVARRHEGTQTSACRTAVRPGREN